MLFSSFSMGGFFIYGMHWGFLMWDLGNFLAIDTETYLIGEGRVAPKVVSVQLCDDRREPWVITNSEDVVGKIKSLIDTKILVGANIAFDMGALCHSYPELQESIWRAYTENRVLCCMVLEKLIHISHGWEGKDPRSGAMLSASLAAMVRVYLGDKMEGKEGEDVWRFRYRELDGVPLSEWPDDALSYAANDALYTWDVFVSQYEFQIQHDKLCPDVYQRGRGHFALHLMGCWGLRTDKEYVDKLGAKVRSSVDSARMLLKKAKLIKEDGKKDLKAIREKVESAYRFRGKEPPVTEKGSVSTSKTVLEKSGDSDLGLLASISNDEKLLTTYIPVLEKGTKLPINPSYNPIVNTGRTSCRNPNIQNQPRVGGVRECWIPREGNVYVQADYSVAELCALAQCCIWLGLDSDMADALNSGKDLHLDMASKIIGCPYSIAEALYKEGNKEIKKARQTAKALNFGFPGGLGIDSFISFAKAAYNVDMEPDEAKKLKKQWLDAYPEMVFYFKAVKDRLAISDRFELRQWRSSRIRGNVGFTDGCNSPFQGLIADLGIDMCFHVARACYLDKDSPLYGSRPVAFVHDEIILESPRDTAHECAVELKAIMERRADAWCPDVKIKAEPCIMNRWLKDAETKYDSNGRIIPWG